MACRQPAGHHKLEQRLESSGPVLSLRLHWFTYSCKVDGEWLQSVHHGQFAEFEREGPRVIMVGGIIGTDFFLVVKVTWYKPTTVCETKAYKGLDYFHKYI